MEKNYPGPVLNMEDCLTVSDLFRMYPLDEQFLDEATEHFDNDQFEGKHMPDCWYRLRKNLFIGWLMINRSFYHGKMIWKAPPLAISDKDIEHHGADQVAFCYCGGRQKKYRIYKNAKNGLPCFEAPDPKRVGFDERRRAMFRKPSVKETLGQAAEMLKSKVSKKVFRRE